MKIKLGYYLFCFFSVTSCSDNLTVNYYTKLIEENIANEQIYQIPNDSSTFRITSDEKYFIRYYGKFDYIIVGAGSAGAVIANRLSEVKENNILLLEAGGHETNFTDIPALFFYSQRSQFNWYYLSTPQSSACLSSLNKKCPFTRGKGLGGSSIINGLMYVRGNKRDYDNWANQGNPGWSYKDVLPYFIKSENSHIDGDKGYHGTGGYLNVEYHKPGSPQLDAFIQANLELGRKVVDYNGKEQLGVAQTQHNTIYGRRDSTGKAFLKPAMNRPNLKILSHSLATKILIKSRTKKAFGVIFSHKGQLLKAKARKEVILSAGTIGSPQLLMLSGIGPEEHLRSIGIPVKQPLAVGDNLQEHATYYGLQFTTNHTEPMKDLEKYVEEYLNGFGPLTIPANLQGVVFFQTNMSQIPGYPDVQVIMVPANTNVWALKSAFHITDESYNITFAKNDPTSSFNLYLMLLHPKSRGIIRLKSKDPYDYPLIDPRFLSDPQGEDIETMYQGALLALDIVNTNAFRKLNASYIHTTLPACQNYKYFSRKYWHCQLRHLTFHIYHPVGTCKMGPDPQKGAVVNHELKVHGIKKLRVADASIMPEVVSGNTNAAAIMIGEKASALIMNGK